MRIRWNSIITVLAIVGILSLAPLASAVQGGQQNLDQSNETSGVVQLALAQGGGGRGGGTPDPRAELPVPRLANGKPDLSGYWRQPYVSNMARGGLQPVANLREGYDLPYTDWGKAQWDAYDAVANGDYAGTCLPFGMSRSINSPHPTQIIQTNDALAFLWEQSTWFHWVPTNGWTWPEDVPAAWSGYSVGRWEDDTLVIETTGFNGYSKLDTIGHPHSDELRIVQTFERPTFTQIRHTVTIHDPKTYTQPWSNVRTWNLGAANQFIMEYSCMENNLELLMDGSITPWRYPDPVVED